MATMRALRERCSECSGTGWKRGAVGVVQCHHDALRRAALPATPMPLFAHDPLATSPLAASVEQMLQDHPDKFHTRAQRPVAEGIRLVKGARHGR